MKYLVASYNRPKEQFTVKYLHNMGVSKDDIYVGVQTENDLASYTDSIGEIATIKFKPAHNAAGNRNNIISLVKDGENFVIFDDDIKSLALYKIKEIGQYGSNHVASKEEFKQIVEYAEYLLDNGVYAVGTQKNSNLITLFNIIHKDANNISKLTTECMLSGECIFMKKDETTFFDDSLNCIDDLDFSLRAIAEGKTILCINQLTTNKPQDMTNKGGCFDIYQNGGKILAFLKIFERWNNLCLPTRKYGSFMLRHGVRSKKLC